MSVRTTLTPNTGGSAIYHSLDSRLELDYEHLMIIDLSGYHEVFEDDETFTFGGDWAATPKVSDVMSAALRYHGRSKYSYTIVTTHISHDSSMREQILSYWNTLDVDMIDGVLSYIIGQDYTVLLVDDYIKDILNNIYYQKDSNPFVMYNAEELIEMYRLNIL